ncbi:MAG: hypothetical protein ACXADY_07550 [Candidatus Hodarchaeales archaeon]|jgi:hypothetical protein
MTDINLFSNRCPKTTTVFPCCLPSQTYGTTLFWAEEYWIVTQIHELVRKYPQIDFSGLFDPYFMKQFPNLLKGSIHEKIFDTKKFSDISEVTWEDNRQFINIATSHAPSRYIAMNYWETFGDDFGIVTLDAHLDLLDSEFMHGAWITKDLARITTVIGGWAEVIYDFEDAEPSLAFLAPDIDSINTNREFIAWLRDKKIYISLDLDYFRISQTDFLGYSNYWHRNKIIGHSMNIKQMLEEQNKNNQSNSQLLLGEALGFFPNLEAFVRNKKKSLKKQSDDIFITLNEISQLCSKNSATILSIDFVEYSPTCDWQQLTIKELMENYPRYHAVMDNSLGSF